jgi:hypothetical protein
MKLRKAQELTEEREREKSDRVHREHEQGMQRAITAIEDAHKQGRTTASTLSLPDSVLKELRDKGYRVKRVPPGEFAAMGSGESVDIAWE